MDRRSPRTRVAIACQGGGSHTAFTAGVLKRLLGERLLERYDIVGLSGTSGGAVCAWLAWSALGRGEPERAGRLLDAFWRDNSARSPYGATRQRLGRVGEQPAEHRGHPGPEPVRQ